MADDDDEEVDMFDGGEEEGEQGNEDLDLANRYIDGNVEESTKGQYGQKLKHFKQWLLAKHPNLIIRDAIVYPDLTIEILKEFFGFISKKRDRKAEKARGGIVFFNPMQYQSYEHVSGYKSAIAHGYSQSDCERSPRLMVMLKKLFAGYKRNVGKLKQNGEMKTGEGKSPMSFSGFRFLGKTAQTQTTEFETAVFAHVFLVFCWNLLARCCSVSKLMYQHITWENDAMVVVFPTHKGDEEGNDGLPKHVYANPSCPEICPILSFAVYVWCMGFRREGSKAMVFGVPKQNETRFSTWVKRVCGKNMQALLLMGILILKSLSWTKN